MKKYVLENSPLVMVLVDLRFSKLPSKNVSSGLENLKSSLFSLGFSVPHEAELNQIAAKPSPNGQIEFQQTSTKRWDFMNIKRNQGVIFTDESLTLRTTVYRCFEDLNKIWNDVVDAFFLAFEGIEHAGMTRMGLRHMDAFLSQPDESYCDYIKDEWISRNQRAANPKSLFHHRLITETEHGLLRLELEERQAQNGIVNLFPRDISDPEPVGLIVDIKPLWKTAAGDKYAVLDIDHAWEATNGLIQLSKNNIRSTLEGLHTDSSDIFWDFLSPHAERVWGKKLIEEQ